MEKMMRLQVLLVWMLCFSWHLLLNSVVNAKMMKKMKMKMMMKGGGGGGDNDLPAAPAACTSLPSSHSGFQKITFTRPSLPDRTFKIFTPSSYDSQQANNKVIVALHGWCGDGFNFTSSPDYRALANQHKYTIVALDGLGENEGRCNSWGAFGTNTGVSPVGFEPTCDVTNAVGDSECYPSCNGNAILPGSCQTNRCPWTHCQDDDVQFVADVIGGGLFFQNALPDVLCFDKSLLFLAGESNGAMMTWNLLQDDRTAGLFRAAATMIATPHCGYDNAVVATKTPVISITGKFDTLVPPSNPPWPGRPSDTCITSERDWRQRFVTSHSIISTWAAAGGCSVTNPSVAFPPDLYYAGTGSLECYTWCREAFIQDKPPYAVDCAFAGAHVVPREGMEGAFFFFQSWWQHTLSCTKKGKRCNKGKECCSSKCSKRRCK